MAERTPRRPVQHTLSTPTVAVFLKLPEWPRDGFMEGLHVAKRSVNVAGISFLLLLLAMAPAGAVSPPSSIGVEPIGQAPVLGSPSLDANPLGSPTLSIDDVSQVEGTGGSTFFIFQITVTNPNSNAVTVDYGTSNGTAHGTSTGAFGDYTITSGSLTIGPFGTKGSIVIRVTPDDLAENDETFFVNLTNADNAKILDGQGQGTILNDDGSPTTGVGDALVTEFALGRVTPTPSRGTARFDFALPRASKIRLTVLDLQGREVAVVADGHYQPGRHQGLWNGRIGEQSAPAGVYFLRYQTPDRNLMRRIILER